MTQRGWRRSSLCRRRNARHISGTPPHCRQLQPRPGNCMACRSGLAAAPAITQGAAVVHAVAANACYKFYSLDWSSLMMTPSGSFAEIWMWTHAEPKAVSLRRWRWWFCASGTSCELQDACMLSWSLSLPGEHNPKRRRNLKHEVVLRGAAQQLGQSNVVGQHDMQIWDICACCPAWEWKESDDVSTPLFIGRPISWRTVLGNRCGTGRAAFLTCPTSLYQPTVLLALPGRLTRILEEYPG